MQKYVKFITSFIYPFTLLLKHTSIQLLAHIPQQRHLSKCLLGTIETINLSCHSALNKYVHVCVRVYHAHMVGHQYCAYRNGIHFILVKHLLAINRH